MGRTSGLALAVLLGAASLAQAQVTVNPGALQGLEGTAPVSPPARERPPPRPAGRAQQAAPAPLPVPPIPPAAPSLPASPPPPPDALAAPVVPAARPVPSPPVPVTPDAPGAVTAVAGGQRVTFGPDRTDLNPVTEAALREFARSMRESEAAINVHASAAGGPEDPSTPRRLSLARALAARAVLISEGIPSARIYVRALGAAGGNGPADRVDVTSASRPGTP